MTAAGSLVRIALRTASTLFRAGLGEQARLLIASAFARYEAATSGEPSEKAAHMETFPDASPSGVFIAALWCGCERHMVATPGGRCPSCLDDERRGVA